MGQVVSDRFCPECGRKMNLKEVNPDSFITGYNPETGEKQYDSKQKIVGKFCCPSFWCRLFNYNAGICHYQYYLCSDNTVHSTYIGD